MLIMTWVRSWIAKLLTLLRLWRRRPAAREDTEATPQEVLATVVPIIQTPADADLPPASSVTGNRDMEPPIDNADDVDEPEVIEDHESRNDSPATSAHVHEIHQSPANAMLPMMTNRQSFKLTQTMLVHLRLRRKIPRITSQSWQAQKTNCSRFLPPTVQDDDSLPSPRRLFQRSHQSH